MSEYNAMLQMLRGLTEDIAALRAKVDKSTELQDARLEAIREQVTTNRVKLSLVTAGIALMVSWVFNQFGLGK